MKVMVIVKATDSSEAGTLPSQELMLAMDNFNAELVKAGIMQVGEGLKPSSEAKRVHFQGTSRTVIDGPFAETKELIAGYWIWEVSSMQQAIDWVKRCPNPMPEDSDIDIRPVYTMDDFAPIDPTGELREKEHRMAHQIALQSVTVSPYLFFGGRCEEAIQFYEQAIGARLIMKMRFDESPDSVPAGMLQAGFESKIMHASLQVGKLTLMMSDGCDDRSKFDGFRLALSYADADTCKKAFEDLAAGGKVGMPLTKTFWSPLYGMLTDQFGIGWMVMVTEQPS